MGIEAHGCVGGSRRGGDTDWRNVRKTIPFMAPSFINGLCGFSSVFVRL